MLSITFANLSVFQFFEQVGMSIGENWMCWLHWSAHVNIFTDWLCGVCGLACVSAVSKVMPYFALLDKPWMVGNLPHVQSS